MSQMQRKSSAATRTATTAAIRKYVIGELIDGVKCNRKKLQVKQDAFRMAVMFVIVEIVVLIAGLGLTGEGTVTTDSWDNFESPQERAEREREEQSRDGEFGQKDHGDNRAPHPVQPGIPAARNARPN